ncbi:unnamed protein product [Thlaspi arvense]|uniref:Homeobox domain-containing protein n=1 Tax=Thlaspi arvense TaxID=13288 RepID=A0AAU9S0G6_THLAR|nr:unnamed protein product [Thlaspi arvense]
MWLSPLSQTQISLTRMGSSSMKVHQFARVFWDHEPSLSLGCKRLRPLAPKLGGGETAAISPTALDLKTFIRPDSVPRTPVAPRRREKPLSTCMKMKLMQCKTLKNKTSELKIQELKNQTTHHPLYYKVETHPGGTRWNPTQEQIRILEMLYRGGMRTPNAQQIEEITAQLGKYGRIEGKNVFYWFQNHKARERQKQKRDSLGFSHSTRTPSSALPSKLDIRVLVGEEDSPYKRKCRTWTFECWGEDSRYCKEEGDRTLELFPLHPEGR